MAEVKEKEVDNKTAELKSFLKYENLNPKKNGNDKKSVKDCKVYISCANAKKLKNKLKDFDHNRIWFNYQKILRLHRYLGFLKDLLEGELESYTDKRKSSHRTGSEKSILFISISSYAEFWMKNINYLIGICDIFGIKKFTGDNVGEINEINEINDIKHALAMLDDQHKKEALTHTQLEILQRFTSAENYEKAKESAEEIINDMIQKINEYIEIIKRKITVELPPQPPYILDPNRTKTEEYLKTNNNPIFDDFYDYYNGGDIIEVTYRHGGKFSKNNKGCITQIKFTKEEEEAVAATRTAKILEIKFVVTYFSTILKELFTDEIPYKNLCIINDPEYKKCTDIEKEHYDMTMQPSDSQSKFIFDLKYTSDSTGTQENKQEDCKIVITIANAQTLLNKLNKLKKENSVDNAYELDNPIEIKYKWVIKIPKKGNKEILSFKCEITHIIPKKKKFRIRKKLMNEKPSLVKLRNNFNPKKFLTMHRFSSLCIVNNYENLNLLDNEFNGLSNEPLVASPTSESESATIIDAIIAEALKESEEIKNNNATRVKSRQDTATSKLAVAGVATAGVLALGPIGFFLGVSLIYAGLFAAMAHSLKKIDKQNDAIKYLKKRKEQIDAKKK